MVRPASICSGGGRSFGPNLAQHAIECPRKCGALALKHALSAKAKGRRYHVIDKVSGDDGQGPRRCSRALTKLRLEHCAHIDGATGRGVALASRAQYPESTSCPCRGSTLRKSCGGTRWCDQVRFASVGGAIRMTISDPPAIRHHQRAGHHTKRQRLPRIQPGDVPGRRPCYQAADSKNVEKLFDVTVKSVTRMFDKWQGKGIQGDRRNPVSVKRAVVYPPRGFHDDVTRVCRGAQHDGNIDPTTRHPEPTTACVVDRSSLYRGIALKA